MRIRDSVDSRGGGICGKRKGTYHWEGVDEVVVDGVAVSRGRVL